MRKFFQSIYDFFASLSDIPSAECSFKKSMCAGRKARRSIRKKMDKAIRRGETKVKIGSRSDERGYNYLLINKGFFETIGYTVEYDMSNWPSEEYLTIKWGKPDRCME